jgi:prepilin-type N-terminal cleavage/methylation domain-containing protein
VERRAARAFTLIELLAVLLIMGLVAGITLPNLSLGSERAVLGAAQQLGADLSFARQRAVATGSTHRVVIDLDAAAWWMEQWPKAAAPEDAAPAAPTGGRREIQMAAPQSAALDFEPLPPPFGRRRSLPGDVGFESVETPAAGVVSGGQLALLFESDGSADPASFLLVNAQHDAVRLEMPRLADEIRIVRE